MEDTGAILSIPLSLHHSKDRMIWAETPSGKFTVKSAYKENRDGSKADYSNPSTRKKVCKGLWRMNLPQKVKHFAWKACEDILASKEALRQRHIAVEGGCVLCGDPMENIIHILWFCAHAKEVWALSKFTFPFNIGPKWSFLDGMEKLQRHKEFMAKFDEKVYVYVLGNLEREKCHTYRWNE